MDKKELRSLYNFYKKSERGFVTMDGYAEPSHLTERKLVWYMRERYLSFVVTRTQHITL